MVMNVADALAAYRNGGGVSGKVSTPAATQDGDSFAATLQKFATDTVDSVRTSEKAVLDNFAGKTDLATVVTAISNAELMLQTAVTIRDKVVTAYQEITRTQI